MMERHVDTPPQCANNNTSYCNQDICFLSDLPDDKAWGKNKKKFYGADVEDDIGKTFCIAIN